MRLLIVLLLLTSTLLGCANSEAESPEPTAIASPSPDFFQQGISKASAASKATQSAKTEREWNSVAEEWKAAIALLQQVPESSQNRAVAQQKAQEYQKNLAYAQTAVAQQKQKTTALLDRIGRESGYRPQFIDWGKGSALTVPASSWQKLSKDERSRLVDFARLPGGWAIITGQVKDKDTITLDSEVCTPFKIQSKDCLG